jgi:glycosyltransferase involved in cell wall biosynthesis
MRVLILNHNLPERGTYFRAREVAQGFLRQGHSVTFVCTGEGFYRPRHFKEPNWQEIQTASWTPFREPGEGYSPLGMLQRLFFLRGEWDLVYTFSHLPVDQGVARFLRSRTKFWMTDWCDLWSSTRGGILDTRYWQKPLSSAVRGLKGMVRKANYRLDDRLEELSASGADGVSLIVTPMRRETRRLGVPDSRVLHLVSGADTQRITPLDKQDCREQLGIPTNRPVLGYVANSTPDNSQLEQALKRVWKEMPSLLVLSVGPRWYLKNSFIEKAVHQGRMIDFDRQPYSDIPLYLGASDFLAMPLRSLPFNWCRWPNKFGDYMASGRPTATCNVGDMGKVIGKYGVGVVGEPTEKGLAQAILKLAGDPKACEEAGFKARETAVNHFSWEKQLLKLFGFLGSHGLDV